VTQSRDGTRQHRGAGRALDRDRDRVVNQQGHRRDLGDLGTEVVTRHHVRTTAVV